MNICVLYHGQLKTFKNVVESHISNIMSDDDLNYSVLYTTWKSENVDDFADVYKNSYIRQVDPPKREQMVWDSRFRPHIGNPHYNGDVFPYFCQLTIWREAYKTLLEYENLLNIKFDVIVRLRPDTLFLTPYSFDFKRILKNCISVPSENKFNVYNTGSVPDQIAWGSRDDIIKILNESIDIADKVQQEQFVFHPETSLHNIIRYHNMNIRYCDLKTDVLK